MSSVCKSAVGCVDARVPVPVPVRATYVNLYKWPESDAEFVRGLTEKNHAEHTAARGNTNNAPVIRTNATACRFGPSPPVVDSYSCRQIFLKSYTFTKKETVTQKTVRCFLKVKEKAACGRPRSDSDEFSDGGATNHHHHHHHHHHHQKKKSKGCVKRLKEASYSALSSIFHGLLSCSVGVDVEDQRFQGS